jgi:DNA cross-link repair 1C protein
LILCLLNISQILLRLEKYPHRMNFAKGIVETYQQTYKHLKTLLKTIPLETPTVIELSPSNEIRVTLFDANHCTGAAMFLIQGHGKAILYTGDIRSEIWWVNSLVQNPILLPHALGSKRLDRIYLDTTFAIRSEPYREFSTKAEGLRELFEKVERYPADTEFYLESWTFGYENVWIGLSALLHSQVHLDRYRWGIYKSLGRRKEKNDKHECIEAPPLLGFQLGNHERPGCLTVDPHVRIHSCERGSGCPIIHKNPNIIRIVPIVTRLPDGVEIHEMGIGGGKGDLDQSHELKIDDASALSALMQLCATCIPDQEELLKVYSVLTSAFQTDRPPERLSLETDLDNVKLERLVDVLRRIAKEKEHAKSQLAYTIFDKTVPGTTLPTTITFPYSRHSSYSELCALVSAFRPRDVYPCTVDERAWTPDVSMHSLFGHLCSGSVFTHDQEMLEMYKARSKGLPSGTIHWQSGPQSQTDTEGSSEASSADVLVDEEPFTQIRDPHRTEKDEVAVTPKRQQEVCSLDLQQQEPSKPQKDFFTPHRKLSSSPKQTTQPATAGIPTTKFPSIRDPGAINLTLPEKRAVNQAHESTGHRSFISTLSPPKRQKTGSGRSIRSWAYRAAAGLDDNCDTWDAFGGLSCVKSKEDEIDLGEET